MGSGTVLWAGKHLSDEEELRVRRLVSLLERVGAGETADHFSRFLPERGGEWTPDELEAAAHAGPWMGFDGQVDAG